MSTPDVKMHWEEPQNFLWLWLLPCLIGVTVLGGVYRARRARRFAQETMLVRLTPAVVPRRQTAKAAVFLGGVLFLILALCRPQYGEQLRVVSNRGIDMFILLDVSRSMLADDVAPSRLERAKSDIQDLLEQMEGDRVGLIVFAGAPVIQVPLTRDFEFFRDMLRETDTDSAPRGGSLIGRTIRKATDAFGPETVRDRAIVLITDGQDQDSAPLDAAREANAAGIRIFTVGLGDTDEGARIPIRDRDGNLQYVTHDGQQVWSKMNEDLLRSIALETGGAYVPARTSNYDLGQLYEDHLEQLTRVASDEQQQVRLGEQFQWFLLAGLILLVIYACLPQFSVRGDRA